MHGHNFQVALFRRTMGKKSKKKSKGAAVAKAEITATFPPNVELNVGDRVSLRALQSAQYNGKLGVIASVPKSADGGRYGVLVDGTDAPVAIRSQNIFVERRRKSTQQQLEERDQMKSAMSLPKEQYADADQMGMMRMMMNMFMTEEHQIKIYGRKIDPMPNFQDEVMNASGGIPAGVDLTWANKYLHLAFENASANPHLYEVFVKCGDYKPSSQDYIKRLGTNERSKMEWYFGCNIPGSISRKHFAHPYHDFFRHSFSNQAYRKEALHRGTTHVAVGFVDLGILFASTLEDPPGSSDGPLCFLGIEASAYAVAKTHVIWEMFKQTPAAAPQRDEHLRSILQVWFSATWGEGTESAVKAALVVLCSSKQVYHPTVREMLRYWADAPPFPLTQARDQLMKATTDSFSSIGHLLKKRDRVALGIYELTRDFCVRGRPVCGNTLMFDCPDGTPPLENDETVFSAFSWIEIMGLLQNKSKMSVVEAAEAYGLAKMGKIASWATLQKVVVELKCAQIQDVIDDIAARKPWTMSWSNLCDYIDYADFHQMARHCSVHGDTIHFGYSMNWVHTVYGVNIIDFAGPEYAELRASLLDSTNQSVQGVYKLLGWDQHLRSPPPTNPINTTSQSGLEILHFKKWLDYFFELARRQGPCQVANVEHAMGSPLSGTGASTVAFTWTYDPDIHFNNVNLM